MQTRGHARAYAASVMEKVGIAQQQREVARRRAHMKLPVPIVPAQTAQTAAVHATMPVAAPTPPENVIEVVLASGERLRVPSDPTTLRMVLAVLREQSPR